MDVGRWRSTRGKEGGGGVQPTSSNGRILDRLHTSDVGKHSSIRLISACMQEQVLSDAAAVSYIFG